MYEFVISLTLLYISYKIYKDREGKHMKQILKILENIVKVVFTYVVLPFIISTSIITLIDAFNSILSCAFPTISSLLPCKDIKFINIIDSIFRINFISLFMIVSAILTITRIEISYKKMNKIKLNDVMYICSNKNFKNELNSFNFCYLRI